MKKKQVPEHLAYVLFAVPWIICGVLLSWFVVKRFPISGVFETTTTMDGGSPFLHPFLPSGRVSSPGVQEEGWIGQRILGDPVYGSARVPGPYETVELEVEFRPIRQPLLEFGVARDVGGQDLELVPMFFEELQDKAWREVPGGYVRGGVDPIRLTDANPDGLAVWHATTTMPLYADEARSDRGRVEVSLRGAHDFYLVPAGGEIDMTLELQDANRKEGRTVAVFRVFRGEEEIQRKVLETNARRDTRMGTVFEHRIHVRDAEAGVYRIRMQADDDVFIRGIETSSKRWVIGPRLNFGDVVGYATSTFAGTAWTDSQHLVAETFHQEGLQTVTLGSDAVDVERTHEGFRLDREQRDASVRQLSAPNGDIRIVGDGWFALTPDAFFVPQPLRVTDGTRLAYEGIVGVVTPYVRPEDLGDGWYRAQFSFPLEGTEDSVRLVLSAPGILSRAGAVDLRKITARYVRPKLTFLEWRAALLQELKNAWRRLWS